jgi:hypothetical protein
VTVVLGTLGSDDLAASFPFLYLKFFFIFIFFSSWWSVLVEREVLCPCGG